MNLRDLRYVAALAEHGHFGRAAEACHVSQPTLSAQIAKLEAELGVTVFERTGKSIRLTPVGEQILDRAKQAVAAADEIACLARASRDPLSGPIRLGMIPTLAPYLVPHLLPLARKSMPSAPLILVEELTTRLLTMLADGALDAAVLATPPEDDRLIEIPLFTEPFLLALPPDHVLSRRRRLTTTDIDTRELLLLTDGHCLRDQTLDLCNGKPGLASTDLRAASLETLLHLTAAGYGVTLVPLLAWEARGAQDASLIGRSLQPSAARDIRLVQRRHYPRAAAIERLGEVIRRCAPQTRDRRR